MGVNLAAEPGESLPVATPLRTRPPELRQAGAVAAVVALLAATVVATTLIRPEADGDPTPTLPPGTENPAPRTIAAAPAPTARDALAESSPTRVEIPSLGVDVDAVVGLGRTPAGVVEVPAHATAVGWLTSEPTPGEAGTSVLTGHTAFAYERGSFFSLELLRPGDTVWITRTDGKVAVFSVYRVEELPQKYALDHATLPTDHPELRLLTASGGFGSPRADTAVVVSARLTAAVGNG